MAQKKLIIIGSIRVYICTCQTTKHRLQREKQKPKKWKAQNKSVQRCAVINKGYSYFINPTIHKFQ